MKPESNAFPVLGVQFLQLEPPEASQALSPVKTYGLTIKDGGLTLVNRQKIGTSHVSTIKTWQNMGGQWLKIVLHGNLSTLNRIWLSMMINHLIFLGTLFSDRSIFHWFNVFSDRTRLNQAEPGWTICGVWPCLTPYLPKTVFLANDFQVIENIWNRLGCPRNI